MVLTFLHQGRFEEAFTTRGFHGPIDSRHTLLLESIAGADQDLLAASRLVAGDLINALGSSEITQVDPEGRLQLQYIHHDQRLTRIADELGVELAVG